MKLFVKHIKGPVLALSVLLLVLSGCKSTRYVPHNHYLLKDVEIKVDNDKIDKEELSTHIRQKENLKILGFFKFHMWLYNLSGTKKQNGWLKRIGEPPVIYDTGLKNKSVQQLEQYLYNKGYYQAVVHDSVILKNKKAKVIYQITTGDPYILRNIHYQIKDATLAPLLGDGSYGPLLKTGDVFDVDQLEKERLRIANFLQNKGYYKFSEEYIHYKIDTILFPKLVDVEMIIENPLGQEDVPAHHKKYFVSGYDIYIDKQKKNIGSDTLSAYSDTTQAGEITFYHNGEMPIKEGLLLKTLEIEPGEKYIKRKENKTYNNLYALQQFKYVNIQYADDPNQPSDSLRGILSGRIFLPLQVKQNYSFDIEGTNTSGNFGIAGNLNYQHRNLLGGAEVLDITLKWATERQIALIDNESKEYNTEEIGGEVKLSIPGFFFPVAGQKLRLYSMPFTSFSMAYNYQDRPDYIRTIVNATLGYQWRSTAKVSHNFNLLDLNAVHIFSLNSDFIDQIEDLYIKSSYTDHIISSSSYSLTFNNKGQNKRPDYHYFKMNLEASGNFLWVLSSLLRREKYFTNDTTGLGQTSYYTLFDTRFAQYIKGNFEYRYGYRFDKYNMVATRAFAGIAFPYGNFNVTPFEKRYFTGGANGIRAWQVRSLGPGSYAAGEDEYPNQSADIKLEANIEYRFKLFWMLEGALFVDAGNIWAINQYDNREGAVFQFDRFYKEFAVGTGFGLRLVSNYFILRADLGLKLRDPSLSDGTRWIPQNRSFSTDDLNLNIAIGYPF